MLKTIAKLLRAYTPEEMEGLCIEYDRGYWVLEGATELPSFLTALPILISEKAFLYFEGGSPSGDLKAWLEKNMITAPEKVALGTIWPRCKVFHVPLNQTTIDELSLLAEQIAEPELASHIHIYEPGRMILEWHDAFSNEMHIDERFDESRVAEFAHRIGFTMSKYHDSEQDGAK